LPTGETIYLTSVSTGLAICTGFLFGNRQIPVSGFQVMPSNPATITTTGGIADFVLPDFVQKQAVPGPQWLAQMSEPGELVCLPGNGRLSGRIYKVEAAGWVVIPPSAILPKFNVILNQNYFSNPNPTGSPSSIQVSKDAIATLTESASLTAGVVFWSLSGRLSGNGRRNGILICEYTIRVGSSVYQGKRYSNRDHSAEPVIQLSISTDFSGSPGTGQFEARMTRFELLV
jgi:hypothetical protein